MTPDMPLEDENWIQRAEALLQAQYALVCESVDFGQDYAPLKIAPALDPDEARNFVSGLEQGLFTVDPEGYVQSPLLPPPSGKNTRQKMLQLFWTRKNGRTLFREGICQLATVARLILEHGWSKNHIIMEPGIAEFGNLAYGVDIVIRDVESNVTISGEVKKDTAEFEKLIAGFRACCTKGPHTKADCAFPQNHAKYEFCAATKSSYFFATAPGQTICFSLAHDGDMRIIDETHQMPKPASMLHH